MSRASQILAGDPAMVLKARQAALADAPAPADRGPYPHGTECARQDVDPVWELVGEAPPLWKRQCGQRGCGVAQFDTPVPPPRPPEPDAEALRRWVHGRDELPCPAVKPAYEAEFVRDEGDLLGHWVTRCRVCSSVRHWRAEAEAHYREHDATLAPPDRPRTFSLDQVTGPSPDEVAERDREALRRGLRGEP